MILFFRLLLLGVLVFAVNRFLVWLVPMVPDAILWVLLCLLFTVGPIAIVRHWMHHPKQ